MATWWVMDAWHSNPVFLVSWVVWVIVSITLHELGHGWMAIRCGDDTPIALGHMTPNPFVHIPWPWAWLMFAVFGFTWGLMPVNPARFQGRYDDAKVAFAGPLVNLMLAALCLLLDILWLSRMTGIGDPFHARIHTFLWMGIVINLMGFAFNLIPIPPLDGSRILADFFPQLNDLYRRGQWVILIAAVLMFRMGGELWGIIYVASAVAVQAALTITGGDWRNPFESV